MVFGTDALMLLARKKEVTRNNRRPPRVADLRTDVSTERRVSIPEAVCDIVRRPAAALQWIGKTVLEAVSRAYDRVYKQFLLNQGG